MMHDDGDVHVIKKNIMWLESVCTWYVQYKTYMKVM